MSACSRVSSSRFFDSFWYLWSRLVSHHSYRLSTSAGVRFSGGAATMADNAERASDATSPSVKRRAYMRTSLIDAPESGDVLFRWPILNGTVVRIVSVSVSDCTFVGCDLPFT